jgi:hypothetical protein
MARRVSAGRPSHPEAAARRNICIATLALASSARNNTGDNETVRLRAGSALEFLLERHQRRIR